MEIIEGDQAAQTVKIGPDRVTITAQRVVIEAKHEMPDWQVREFSAAPVYFRDQKMFLRQKLAAKKPFAALYVLEPWPEGMGQAAHFHTYDEETVAQREGAVRGGRVDDVGRSALILLYPVLGFLWSRTKEKLRRFGFEPRGITSISIFLGFGLILLEGAFAKMFLFGSLKSGNVVVGGMIRAFAGKDYWEVGIFQVPVLPFDILLFVFLVLDVLIRYTAHLRDDETCWGFCEWLLAPRKKKTALVGAPPALVAVAPTNANTVSAPTNSEPAKEAPKIQMNAAEGFPPIAFSANPAAPEMGKEQAA